MILMVVDYLSKQAIFVLIVNTITLYNLAKLFIIYIFSKHSVLSHVTSNYRSEFISNFFWFLDSVLNIWLHFTSKYYLERDNQMEYTN